MTRDQLFKDGRRLILLPPSVERATRAVLFVDVVEYVRLVEQDEESVVSRWLSFAERVEADVLLPCHGRMVQRFGDGLLLEFADAQAAVQAAFAIQHASRRDNVGVPPERQILLRTGIEISDVFIDRQEVFGHGVNLAARLTTLAGPGEIVVSARVRDHLTPALDAEIEDLGECFLKHVQHFVRAYRVGPPGPRPAIKPGISMADLMPTIAVIPFTPRAVGPEHEVIGEVLAEEVIRQLSRSAELNVISRLSTTVFRGRQATLAEINAHLNADYVLSGIYRVWDQQVTLDAELAEAKTARVVWSQRVKGRIEGILDCDQQIVSHLVADVSSAVMSRELKRVRSQALPTLKSYSLLMGAIGLMHRMSLEDFEEAHVLLQTLIDRATRQSVAYAWLAHWYVLRVQQGWSSDQQRDSCIALECTRRALDTDPDCSLALAIDGAVHTNLLKRLDVAEERYRLALAANPNNALAWMLKGTMHAFSDQGSTAVQCTEMGLRLSPLDPHRYYYDSLAASARLTAGQYENARALAERSLRANRSHTSTLRVLAVAQWQLGLRDDARATVRRLLQLEPELTIKRYLKRTPAASYRIGKEIASVLCQAGVPD
jgi:class 3 adenylate cyclase/TolB-like protein